jgi:hypothetical protein
MVVPCQPGTALEEGFDMAADVAAEEGLVKAHLFLSSLLVVPEAAQSAIRDLSDAADPGSAPLRGSGRDDKHQKNHDVHGR